jgi:hypothetical protein
MGFSNRISLRSLSLFHYPTVRPIMATFYYQNCLQIYKYFTTQNYSLLWVTIMWGYDSSLVFPTRQFYQLPLCIQNSLEETTHHIAMATPPCVCNNQHGNH